MGRLLIAGGPSVNICPMNVVMRIGLLLIVYGLSAPVLADVHDLLKGYEWEVDEIRARLLTADEVDALIEIADDPAEIGFVRSRATALLAYVPSNQVWQFFTLRISKDENEIERRRNVDSFCQAFSGTRSGELIERIGHMLDDEDAHLRIGVARCLKKIDSEQSAKLLDAYHRKSLATWERRAVALD